MRRSANAEWVEGAFDEADVLGPPFDCCLFLPQGTEAPAGRGRRVKEPTLLVPTEAQDGAVLELKATDELLLTAPELNVAQGLPEDAQVRWMIVGAPQLFGRPGDDVIGGQATLRRVED